MLPSSSCSHPALCHSSSSAGESAADWRGGVGEMVRPGLQHQSGGRGHLRGHLPLGGGLCGTVRCDEAPPGPALLRILECFLVVCL